MRDRVLTLDHTPRPQPPKTFTAYNLAQLAFLLFGIPKNGFISVDVTNRCNLRCSHCYFFEQDCAGKGELTPEEWVAFFERMRAHSRLRQPMMQCTWVGGEPLLRKDVIERCRKFFRYNTVVTNGTMELPHWPDTHFFFSVDGTEELHDSLRNKPGLYRRIKKHANHPGLDITIACCITRDNWQSVEALVREWNQVEGVGQMTFDFYTPISSIDQPLWLGWELRDHVVEILLALKRIYGDFIITPSSAFRLMKSDRCASVTDDCLFARKSTAYGPRGEAKPKCMMGESADCGRCGCVVPFYLQTLVDPRLALRDALSKVQRRYWGGSRS